MIILCMEHHQYILSQIRKDYLKPMVLSNLAIPVSHIPLVLGELVHA